MKIYSDTLHWSDQALHQFFYAITDLDLITDFDFLPYCERFPWNICNGYGMPTEDAYSSGHLSCPILDLQMFYCWDHWHSTINYTTSAWPFSWFDFLLNLTLLNTGFHGASATGLACRQGTLTPPDTWSCPALGLANVLMFKPIPPELVLFPDF